MNVTRLTLPTLMASLAVVATAACYSTSDTSDPGVTPDAGSTGAGRSTTQSSADAGTLVTDPGTSATAFALGQSLVQMYACTSCHGADLSGNLPQSSGVYSANITPDMETGIGSWTLANLTSALRDGIDDQGEMICSAMPKFPSLSDDDIVDLYAYLQGIPAVSKAQTDTDCQGNPQSGDDDDDDDDAGADGGTDASDAGAEGGTDSGADAGDLCPHKVCVEGAALAASCGSCAKAVCSHDPSCCATSWGATCLTEVNEYCITQCN